MTSLLGFSDKKYFAHLVLRADSGNANTVWIGKSDVTTIANQMGFLKADESLAIDLSMFTNTDELYLVAGGASTVYALGVA